MHSQGNSGQHNVVINADTYQTLNFPTTWQYYLTACEVFDQFFTPYFKNHQYQRNDDATNQNQEYSSHVIQVETFCVSSF